MKEKKRYLLFWTLMFLGALLILSQVGYSDGDDVFFYQYSRSMGFFEYLSWRYESWVGRMAGEAMVYVAFRSNIWLWRIVDALMLVLLPVGIIRLAEKTAGVRSADIWHGIASVSGYFLMAATTFGYAAVWMNGSIFYTWSFTCGIWALQPVADLVFDGEHFKRRQLFYAIPCAVIASMSIEQMGAVLFTLELLAVLFLYWRDRKISWELCLQTAVTAAAFAVLFLAPGNELRVASEVTNWMPQYPSLTFGQHLFITAQWLISSFANENKLFLAGIWMIGILLLKERRKDGSNDRSDSVWMCFAGIFTVVSCLPFLGITVLSDVGMDIGDIMLCIDRVPEVSDLTTQNVIALIFWGVALIFTFVYLWKITGHKITLLLAYLAGIASEAIMYFSPTMYASGARVYYLTDLLYLYIILTLSMKLKQDKWRKAFEIGMMGMGILHFLYQFKTFAIWLS